MSQSDYKFLLSSVSARQWKRLGTQRRSGVALPLFSLYSAESVGIGEMPDLKLLIDWCVACKMSVIQLLPMNDVGFSFTPYDAQSMFALEPMYLSLSALTGAKTASFENDIRSLRDRFPCGRGRVNYAIKGAKLELLWRIFKAASPEKDKRFQSYVKKNRYWLKDYALFKVIKELNRQKGWQDWDEPLRRRDPEALKALAKEHSQSVFFHEWLQWQLFEQFKDVRSYAAGKEVFFMGDLPFLVARDSADVWSHQDYFKMDRVAGAPPDAYIAIGQRWGMPAYRWETIAESGYDYLIEKLRYAENFYDHFRIDHSVGLFRLWTIAQHEPQETGGLNGVFDPADEELWEEHGQRLLEVMIQNTKMLPCAEDLGVVPKCSFTTLESFGVLGMDVQRWQRDWEKSLDFKDPEAYRKNAIALISTHDMSNFCGWWLHEAGTVDEALFKRKCEEKGIVFAHVAPLFFDQERSDYGRLKWKKDLTASESLLRILGRPEQEVSEIVRMHKETFDEQKRFLKYLGIKPGKDDGLSGRLIRAALEKASESISIFCVQLIQDWLALAGYFTEDPWHARINFPGIVNDRNWSIALPLSLEEMLKLDINSQIRDIHDKTGRV